MPLCDVFKVRKHVRSLHCSTLITPQKILKTQLPPQKKNKSYQEKNPPNKQNSSNKKKIQKNTKKTKQIKIMIKIPHRYGKKDSLEFRGT